MSHIQHIRPWLAHVIQPLPETGHSDLVDRQKRCAPLFHMTGILALYVESAVGTAH